ncbi:MAG: NADH:flavin oxidoreductase/NADH oxidase [Candidatus Lambdaproteobacteria bacterium]|nr:NADH:flavin oxidoreductase/NADH oxidase [Candidatus Lambdaproteobacteria bacterium]
MTPSVLPAQRPEAAPHLFRPIIFRSVTARNRIMLSPMCEYSAREGLPNDWHLVHLGARAVGGTGIISTEATAVEARGRITPGCLGLYNDAQQEAFARICAFLSAQGAVPAIQLAHAGRKASCRTPWEGRAPLRPEEGGWETIAPSPIPFEPSHPTPIAMTARHIAEVTAAFAASARRALDAGFRIVEVHAAHGYLIQEFLSPLSNRRTDRYGGSLENRARLLLEVLDAVRAVWPASLPLFVRISSTDWVEGGWELEQSLALARLLKARGDVDLIDCSSGGNDPRQKIPATPGFQVPFAEAIRRETGMATGAVGLIRTPEQAEAILARGQADLIVMGRMLMSNPHWPLQAAKALGFDHPWPIQYLRSNMD